MIVNKKINLGEYIITVEYNDDGSGYIKVTLFDELEDEIENIEVSNDEPIETDTKMVSNAVVVEQDNLIEPPINPVEEPQQSEFEYSDNDSVGSENSDINPIQKFEGHDLFKNTRWKHNGVDITEIIKKKTK